MKNIQDKTWKQVNDFSSEDTIISSEKIIKKHEDEADIKMLPLIILKNIVSVTILILGIKYVYEFTRNNMMQSYLDYKQSRALVVAVVDTIGIFASLSTSYMIHTLCPFCFSRNNTLRTCIKIVRGINDSVIGVNVYVFKGNVKNSSLSDKSMYISVEELKDTIIKDKITFIVKDEELKEIENNKMKISERLKFNKDNDIENKDCGVLTIKIQNNFNNTDTSKLKALIKMCKVHRKGDKQDVQD